MKRKIKIFITHPLISGSSAILLASFFSNVLNTFYHFFMVSKLSPVDYGILASIISLMVLPGYAVTAVYPLVVQFSGMHFANHDYSAVKYLYSKVMKFILIFGLTFFLLYLFFSHQIGSFFKISDTFLLMMTDLYIFIGFISIINTALIQAKLSFNFIAFTTLATTLLKLSAGIIFVMIGMKVTGAVLAILLSAVFSYFLSFIPLRFLFEKTKKLQEAEIDTKVLFAYAIPSTLAYLGMNSLISTDILLVKHFSSAETAGLYSGLSLAGRVVYFLTAPIATVMFPLVVQKKANNKNYNGTFFLSILLVGSASIFITFVYYFFPEIIIKVFLRKEEYLKIAGQLGLFGAFITLYSLISLLVNFYLAIKKTFVYLPVIAAAVMQIILIFLWHNSINNIIYISFFDSLVLFIILLLYYSHATKKT